MLHICCHILPPWCSDLLGCESVKSGIVVTFVLCCQLSSISSLVSWFSSNSNGSSWCSSGRVVIILFIAHLKNWYTSSIPMVVTPSKMMNIRYPGIGILLQFSGSVRVCICVFFCVRSMWSRVILYVGCLLFCLGPRNWVAGFNHSVSVSRF